MPSPFGMTVMLTGQPSASCGISKQSLKGLPPPQSTGALCWPQVALLTHCLRPQAKGARGHSTPWEPRDLAQKHLGGLASQPRQLRGVSGGEAGLNPRF